MPKIALPDLPLFSKREACLEISRFGYRCLIIAHAGTLIFQGCARKVTWISLLSSASLITLAKVSAIGLVAIAALRLFSLSLLYAKGEYNLDAVLSEMLSTTLETLALAITTLSLFGMGGGFTPPPPPHYSWIISPLDDG